MSRSSQGDTADFLKRYTKDERTLGSGAYGVVYKATCMKTGETVALKKIKMEGTDEGIPGTALREISVLRTLKHPNIVHLRDVEPSKGRLYLVFEYCDHDLKHFMDAIPTRRLDKLLVKQLTFQLMVGLVYCHKRGIVHRDLKPQNLLIDSRGNLKIADFGLARAVCIPIRAYTHEVVTLWYRAPEILLGCKRYSLGVDIWSVGCILAELACKRALWPGDSEIDMLMRIFRILGTPNDTMWPGITSMQNFSLMFPKWPARGPRAAVRDEKGDSLDADGHDVLAKLFRFDPSQRMSAKASLRHPWFDEVRDDPRFADAYAAADAPNHGGNLGDEMAVSAAMD